MIYLLQAFGYLIICVFIYLPAIHASVILNEIAIQPTQTVELVNTDATGSADISSWFIDDSGGTTYYTIASDTWIPPLSCLLFTGDFNFNKASTDTVRLFNSLYVPTTSSAILIDSYQYTKAPDSGYSFSRKIDGKWEMAPSSLGLSNDMSISCIPSPTPTPEPTLTPPPTSTPEPTQTPTATPPIATPAPQPSLDYSNIYISEIFPYPEVGENEWIEIYNSNEISVELIDWYIDDGENTGGTPKRFSLSLAPYEYKSIEISTSLFNNAGDVVRLLNTEKKEKESMEYGKITRGKSIGRVSFEEDGFCEQEPSQNSQNNSCIEQSPSPIPTLVPTHKPTSPTASKKYSLLSSNVLMAQPAPKKINYRQAPIPIFTGQVLGDETSVNHHSSPIPYLSGISFSYSALTIVSIFIKMKNA